MVDFRFGPVELYLVSLDGDRPAPAVIAALTDLVAAGTVNLLDFVVVSKAEDGTVTAIASGTLLVDQATPEATSPTTTAWRRWRGARPGPTSPSSRSQG